MSEIKPKMIIHMRVKRPTSDIGTKRVMWTRCGVPVDELVNSSHTCFAHEVTCELCYISMKEAKP